MTFSIQKTLVGTHRVFCCMLGIVGNSNCQRDTIRVYQLISYYLNNYFHSFILFTSSELHPCLHPAPPLGSHSAFLPISVSFRGSNLLLFNNFMFFSFWREVHLYLFFVKSLSSIVIQAMLSVLDSVQSRRWQMFSLNGQLVNMLCFSGDMVSVTTAQL